MPSEPGRRLLCACLLLAAALVLLRAGLVEIRQGSSVMQEQRAQILERGIDPAALFYTELPLALAAEKEVRRRLDAQRDATTAP